MMLVLGITIILVFTIAASGNPVADKGVIIKDVENPDSWDRRRRVEFANPSNGGILENTFSQRMHEVRRRLGGRWQNRANIVSNQNNERTSLNGLANQNNRGRRLPQRRGVQWTGNQANVLNQIRPITNRAKLVRRNSNQHALQPKQANNQANYRARQLDRLSNQTVPQINQAGRLVQQRIIARVNEMVRQQTQNNNWFARHSNLTRRPGRMIQFSSAMARNIRNVRIQ